MSDIVILCVEDDREVLDALVRDLSPFSSAFRIEAAETADEARKVVADLLAKKVKLALVLADHIMPGGSGVDFLIDLNHDDQTRPARKVLVTAQAGLADTIKAVNEADLHHYIAKPWNVDELHAVVKKQLTDYVIEQGENVLPFMPVLDAPRLMESLRGRVADA